MYPTFFPGMDRRGLNLVLNLVWICVLVRFARCAHLSGAGRVGRVGEPIFSFDPFSLASSRAMSSASSSAGRSRSSASSTSGSRGSSRLRTSIGISPGRVTTRFRLPARRISHRGMTRQMSPLPSSRFSAVRPVSSSRNRLALLNNGLVSRPQLSQPSSTLRSLGNGLFRLEPARQRPPSGLSFLRAARGSSDMILMSGKMPILTSLPIRTRPALGQGMLLLNRPPASPAGQGLIILGRQDLARTIKPIPQATSSQRNVTVAETQPKIPKIVRAPVAEVKAGTDLGKLLGSAGSQLTIQGQTPTGGLILSGPGGSVTIGADILTGIQHNRGPVSHTEFEEIEAEEFIPANRSNHGLTVSGVMGKDVVLRGTTMVVNPKPAVVSSNTGATGSVVASPGAPISVISPTGPALNSAPPSVSSSSSNSAAAASSATSAGASTSSSSSSSTSAAAVASSPSAAASAAAAAAATAAAPAAPAAAPAAPAVAPAAGTAATSSSASAASSSPALGSSAASAAASSGSSAGSSASAGPIVMDSATAAVDASFISLPRSSVSSGQSVALGHGMILSGGVGAGQVFHLRDSGQQQQQTIKLGATAGRIMVDRTGAGVHVPGNATFMVTR